MLSFQGPQLDKVRSDTVLRYSSAHTPGPVSLPWRPRPCTRHRENTSEIQIALTISPNPRYQNTLTTKTTPINNRIDNNRRQHQDNALDPSLENVAAAADGRRRRSPDLEVLRGLGWRRRFGRVVARPDARTEAVDSLQQSLGGGMGGVEIDDGAGANRHQDAASASLQLLTLPFGRSCVSGRQQLAIGRENMTHQAWYLNHYAPMMVVKQLLPQRRLDCATRSLAPPTLDSLSSVPSSAKALHTPTPNPPPATH